jgi:hypothetical protein
VVGVLLFWPESVTYWISEHTVLDQEAVDEALEGIQMPDMGDDLGPPPELDLDLN